MEARQLETEYVPRNIFDLHLQNIRDNAKSEKELSDEKFEKFQAILEKNLAEYRVMLGEVKAEVNGIRTELKSEIGDVQAEISKIRAEQANMKLYFEEKIEHVTDTLTVAITDLDKRIDDMHQNHNKWFTVFGVLFAGLSIVLAVMQIWGGH